MPLPKHAVNENIPQFPSEIDRDYFGAWLSGFTDGEGCFQLRCPRQRARGEGYYFHTAAFFLHMRADDLAVLRLIQSYWQCGTLNRTVSKHWRIPSPMIVLGVNDAKSLAEIVVPHFDRFPLQSKKARDFAVWKPAIKLLYQIRMRPKGYGRKYTEQEDQEFLKFHRQLASMRKYDPSLDNAALFLG